MHVPLLLELLPRIGRGGGSERPLVEDELRRECPDLEPELDVLDRELVPVFRTFDRDALRAQSTFRLAHLALIVGGLATTTLGAVQAVEGGGDLGVGIAQAAIAFALGAAVVVLERRRAQGEYLTNRLKAERLRGEYFAFLGRVAPYDVQDEAARVARLRGRVRQLRLEAAS